MIFIDRMFVAGMGFVLDQVLAFAEREGNDASHLREELLEAQMQLELGEIDEEAFALVEARVLRGLRELREEEIAGSSALSGDGVTVSIDVDLGDS
jgi:hypothetical protein